MCNKCGLRAKHGRSGMCKPCKNEYNKTHYAANKQYYVDKASSRNQRIMQELCELKQQTPCADCGLNYPSYVMDFDHLGGKEFNISSAYNVSDKRLKAEIAKCEIVCSNCHRERTHQRRIAL